jgi:hypothetical protein
MEHAAIEGIVQQISALASMNHRLRPGDVTNAGTDAQQVATAASGLLQSGGARGIRLVRTPGQPQLGDEAA